MKLRITLLFLFSIFSIKLVCAQSVKIYGKVLDVNQNTIEYANVFIQNTENKVDQKGTITDIEGTFNLEITANENYRLKISFMGYEDWEQIFETTETIDVGVIQLVPAANELGEVVVTSERNIITRKEDKLVFNVAASPLKTGYDGLEILARSPNILVDTDGSITMRNQAPTILINGRISNLPGGDLANYISNIRSENIKSIEIQTHLSANTDGESSGGVINIILKKNPVGFDANLRGQYTIKREGFDSGRGGVNWNYGAKKWNVYGLYNANFDNRKSRISSDIDYFELNELVTSDEIFTSNIKRQNAQLGFVANLSKNQVLGIEGYTSYLDYSSDNLSEINILKDDISLQTGNALVTNFVTNTLYSTTLNYAWTLDTLNSSFKFFADYANQKVDRPGTTNSSYEVGLRTDNTERNNSIANTVIYAGQADLEKYFKPFKLEAGAKITYTDRENGLVSDQFIDEEWVPTGRSNLFNYRERVSAVYLSFNKNLTDKIFMEIGLRVENTDLEKKEVNENIPLTQNYTNWFPNAYLSRDFKNNRTVSLSYSKRLRRPPFYFLNNNAVKINDFRYELGNPDLIPENVNNFEISIKDKKQNFDVYLQRTTEAINGIYYLDSTQVSYYQKFNEGIQQQFGVSYNRFGNLTKWWYVRGLVHAFNRKFISEGDDSFEQLTFRLNLTNNFKINPTTSIDLTARYQGKYADAYYISFPYYSVNLMFQKLFFHKKLTFRFYANDVFNLMDTYSERPFENFRMIRSEKWLSQQFRVWLSYNFNSKNKVNKRKNQSKNEVRRRL